MSVTERLVRRDGAPTPCGIAADAKNPPVAGIVRSAEATSAYQTPVARCCFRCGAR